MNKNDIINKIYTRVGGVVTKDLISDIGTILFNSIADNVVNDKDITIGGFGTFYISKMPKRKVFNVFINDFNIIDSTRYIMFTPDYKLSLLINGKNK